MMTSVAGCTLRITAASTKIRAHDEPEKVREFNRQLTKSEIAQGEHGFKRRETYVMGLETKYESKS